MATKPKKPYDDLMVMKQRIFTWAVVFFLVVVSCSVVVYFLFVKDGGLYKKLVNSGTRTVTVSTAAKNTNGNTNTTASTTNPTKTDIDVQQWQLYTNEEFGYAFKYPEDWGITVNDNAHATLELNPASMGYDEKRQSQLTVSFVTLDDVQSGTTMYVSGMAVKKGIKYVLYGQDTAVIIPYGDYLILFSWPSTITDDGIQQAIVSTFTFTGTALVKEQTSILTYRNDDIHVSFNYPSAWWPVVTSRWYSDWEGGSHLINFYGSAESSFYSRFSLMYNTTDYAPGKEIWQGEILSKYDEEHGLDTLCDQGPTYQWSFGQDVRECTKKQVNGKWQVEYLTRLDALGGGGTIYFVKVFAFQTDNPDYPVGVLSVFLPDSNNVQLPNTPTDGEGVVLVPQDAATVDAAYAKLVNKTADTETNTLLTQFDAVVKTFSYTQ